MMEFPGFIRHEQIGKRWEHPNDILTRLDCTICAGLIMRRLTPHIVKIVGKYLDQHEGVYHRG